MAEKKTTTKKIITKKTAAKKTRRAGAPEIKGYVEAVGRRKTSTARARIASGKGEIAVNGKDYLAYFPTKELQKIVEDSFKSLKTGDNFSVSIKVRGGGIHSQSEAVRHAVSRALIKINADFRNRLKRAGFLKRDPRMKERRKFGLKKARRAPQWSKR